MALESVQSYSPAQVAFGEGEKKKSSGLVPAVLAAGVTFPAVYYGLKSPITAKQVLTQDKFELNLPENATEAQKGAVTEISDVVTAQKPDTVNAAVAEKLKNLGVTDTGIAAETYLEKSGHKAAEGKTIQATLEEATKDDVVTAETSKLNKAITDAGEDAAKKTAATTALDTYGKTVAEQKSALELVKKADAKLKLISKADVSAHISSEITAGATSKVEKSLIALGEFAPKVKSAAKAGLWAAGAAVLFFIGAKIFGGKKEA